MNTRTLEDRKAEFTAAYHNTARLASNINLWVTGEIWLHPSEESRKHLDAISHFSKTIGDRNDNPNPFVLGMLWDAKNKYFDSLV